MSGGEASGPAPPSSFGQILRSSSIIGGASVINIFAGIARQKAAALILGPAGVGLIGLFQNLVSVGTGVASLSVGTSATRQIATSVASGDAEEVASTRKSLVWLTVAQTAVGVALFWLLRGWLAHTVLQDGGQARNIGWLSLAIGFGVVSGAQAGLLLGFRRIGDSARVTVIGALASAVISIAALYWLGARAIALFVILPSVCAAFAGMIYVRRLPQPAAVRSSVGALIQHWQRLAGLGLALTAGGSALVFGQLLLRTMIYRQLGDTALGLFQAAATLSMVYIGFILQAMGADYAPRLAMVIKDREASSQLVNEQTEVALLLAAPFLLVALGGAPLLFHLFYSSAFVDASAIFRWQVLGDVLKLASWPLGFILVARGDGRTFVFTETTATIILLALAWLGMPRFGIVATGVAYFGMYVVYLPVVYWIARRRIGFRWSAKTLKTLVAVATACALVAIASTFSEGAALAAGALLAAISSLLAYRRLGAFLPRILRRG